jgi:hypothetical protein
VNHEKKTHQKTHKNKIHKTKQRRKKRKKKQNITPFVSRNFSSEIFADVIYMNLYIPPHRGISRCGNKA